MKNVGYMRYVRNVGGGAATPPPPPKIKKTN